MSDDKRERPVLFSAPMVRALLAGTKTQTRRVVKPRKDRDMGCELACCELAGEANDGEYRNAYCAPGDRLWVRETFQPLFADGYDHHSVDWETGKGYACRYVATDGRVEWIDGDDNITDRCKPGIHMPRWASRLTLEVTAVRVERLQDISVEDCRAEGSPYDSPIDVRAWYRDLWEQINGPDSWDANPFVWCIEFKLAEGVR